MRFARDTGLRPAICLLAHNSCFNLRANASKVARLDNGSSAYLQSSGKYEGELVANDMARHGQSAYKLFSLVNNKNVQLIADLAADGSIVVAKHSSKLGIIFEVVRWITIK